MGRTDAAASNPDDLLLPEGLRSRLDVGICFGCLCASLGYQSRRSGLETIGFGQSSARADRALLRLREISLLVSTRVRAQSRSHVTRGGVLLTCRFCAAAVQTFPRGRFCGQAAGAAPDNGAAVIV